MGYHDNADNNITTVKQALDRDPNPQRPVTASDAGVTLDLGPTSDAEIFAEELENFIRNMSRDALTTIHDQAAAITDNIKEANALGDFYRAMGEIYRDYYMDSDTSNLIGKAVESESALSASHIIERVLYGLIKAISSGNAQPIFKALVVSALNLVPVKEDSVGAEYENGMFHVDARKLSDDALDVVLRQIARFNDLNVLTFNPEDMRGLGHKIRRLNLDEREIEDIVSTISPRDFDRRSYRDREQVRGRGRDRDERVREPRTEPSQRANDELILSGDKFAEIIAMATGDNRRRGESNPLAEGRISVVIGLDGNDVKNFGIRLNEPKE